jgi:hypothetical protein
MPHEHATPDHPRVCPKWQGTDLRRQKLWRPAALHDLLNPAVAFNELALGQRVPRRTLVCQDCAGAALERTYVPCPHCGAMHAASLWMEKNAFGNWRGLVCPSCLRRIPCLWNAGSLVLLLLTFPFWYVPYRFWFRDRPVRGPVDGPSSQLSQRAAMFLLGSTFFGGAVWLAMVVLPMIVRYFSEGKFDGARFLLSTGVCFCAGLAFGGLMLLLVTDEEVPPDLQRNKKPVAKPADSPAEGPKAN